MSAKINWTLAALFALTMAANFAVRPDPDVPNIDYLPDMAHSAAYASFSPNPILPEGKTMQPPVPGTLPRGVTPLHFQATPEDALRAGAELKSPLDPEKAKIRGTVVYQNFCTPCHGGSMRGDGAVALHGYPAPPNLKGEKSLKLTEGQMFHILTFGQKKMPSYATQLTPEDRWSVIAYVKSAQSEAEAAPSPAAPSPAAQSTATPPAAAQPQPAQEVKK
ncbi:MAG: cytochrome c [Bryobacterales bacterium]|nr:cytochrome c [Bryobacterales bacterium]